MRVRRINLHGGPGTGKSTLAAWLFAELKSKGLEVEHAAEYVKSWAFIGRKPEGFSQTYIFGHQEHREEIILRNTRATVVSECPIRLGICYAKRMNMPGWQHLIGLADEFDKVYPAINFLVVRKGEYRTAGRFESSNEAVEMDRIIEETVGVPMTRITWEDKQKLLNMSLEAIQEPARPGYAYEHCDRCQQFKEVKNYHTFLFCDECNNK